MPYFPQDMPRPNPNFDDREFWIGCTNRQLRFQRCADCKYARHPPTPVCPKCHSLSAQWQSPSGHAEIFSYTVIHHASHDAVKNQLPYVVALITFADMPEVRLVSNVTDRDPSLIKIGAKVELWWDDIGAGMYLPRFQLTV